MKDIKEDIKEDIIVEEIKKRDYTAQKKYQKANRAKCTEINKRWREKNMDKVKAWRTNNHDRLMKLNKKYRINNNDKILENAKCFYNEHKEERKLYYLQNKKRMIDYGKKRYLTLPSTIRKRNIKYNKQIDVYLTEFERLKKINDKFNEEFNSL